MFKGIISLAALSLALSCTDGIGPGFKPDSGRGKIALTPIVDTSVRSSRASRTEYTDIKVADLSLKVSSVDGLISRTYSNVGDFGDSQEFNVGLYTVEAFYGDPDAQGFDVPYFYGAADVKIEEDVTVSTTVTATLANSVISVDYTDKFTAYMTSWSATVNDSFQLSADNAALLYVKPGQVAVDITFVKPNGNGGTIRVATFSASPRCHYHVNVDMAGDGSGVSEGLTVSVDETLDEQICTVDISDAVLDAPVPVVSPSGFTHQQPVGFISGSAIDGSLDFNIIAQAGLQQIILSTSSVSLASQGWPAEIDLLNADAASIQKLRALGLDMRGVEDSSRLAVLSFNDVVGHISYLPGASDADNLSTFTVRVKDRFSRMSEPLTLGLFAATAELSLDNDRLYVMGTTLDINVNYNGGDPSSKVTFRYRDLNGVDRTVSPTFEKLGEGIYRATVEVYASENDLLLTASAPGAADFNYTVVRRPCVFPASGSSANAFARHAYIPVSVGSRDADTQFFASMLADAVVYIAANGGTYRPVAVTSDASRKIMHIKGLTPGTQYDVRIISHDQTVDEAPGLVFVTEQADQIPNGDLDADVTVASSGAAWQNIVFDTWGTNNAMTTSQPTGSNPVGNNRPYKAISGTIQTTDSHNGNAALIRSVGWGSGNSATGSNATSGTCKYTDPGLLHLGASRSVRPAGYGENDNVTNSSSPGPVDTDDLACGIEFASRPSAVSFWYKYSPKNPDDKGFAEAWLKDASGNIIESATILLDATDTYTQVTLYFDFDEHTPPCASLYVKFLSSYDMEYIKRTNANFSGPGFGAQNGTFMGSQLYIDDIELTY